MGFNATVVILLDRLHEIERDPEFGKKLGAAIRYRASLSQENDKPRALGYRPFGGEATGQTEVIEVHHADNQMVVTVGGNTGRVLGWGGTWSADDDAILDHVVRMRKMAEKRSLPRNVDAAPADQKPST